MRIAICDEDSAFRAQILALIEEFSALHPAHCVNAYAFASPDHLLNAANKTGGFDIYLLETSMSGMSGIALGLQLRKLGYDGQILYITASKEHAIDAFEVKPFHYLLKPLDKSAFLVHLEAAVTLAGSKKQASILVRTKDSTAKLSMDNILYAQLQHRSIVYYLAGGKKLESIQIRTTFSKAVQALLDNGPFILCGAGMVANMHHITAVETEALVFAQTYRTYLGRRACREVRAAWSAFWSEKQ